MNTLILLTFLIKVSTPQGDRIKVEDLASVKDMETCHNIAAALNKVLEKDPNAEVICREVTPQQS